MTNPCGRNLHRSKLHPSLPNPQFAMGRRKKKTATGSRLNLTEECHCANEDRKESGMRGEEKEQESQETSNCGESTKSQITSFQNQKHLEDYYPEPEADTQLTWRPPMPIEDGIWKPILVKTNGEGRERLLCAEPLLEVYDVKVDLCGKTKTYGNIHGKIILDCMCYRTCLFNLDKQSALMIDKKGSLPLIGADIAPIAYDPIMIMVDLNIDDDKLCEDIIEWKPINKRTNEWLYDKIKGRNGSVEVTYVVMKDAWLAELDAKLIKSATEETTSSRIHGDIIVYINDMQYLRYFVFSKKAGDCLTVESLESFPLNRSLFCCRSGSSLVVKVDLWNADTNEPFVRGALLFPPEYYGDSVGKLSSPYGEIQVTVNWVYYMEHSKTCDALRGCHPWVDLLHYHIDRTY